MSPVLRIPLSRWNQQRLAVRRPVRRRLRLEFERLEETLLAGEHSDFVGVRKRP